MKKNVLKNKKNIIIISIVALLILVISGALFLYYTLINNYVVYDNIDNSSSIATSIEISNARKIIINNLLIGGIDNTKYIDADLIYNLTDKTKTSDIDMFDVNSSYGTFKTSTYVKYNELVFTKIAKDIVPDEYIAIEHKDDISKSSMQIVSQKLKATKEDIKHVKQALKKYKWLNSTVKITEVYSLKIKENSDKIICVVSDNNNKFAIGAYSAVIYVTNNNAHIVKYAYVKDTKNSANWPIYSFKFAIDVDTDKIAEIILQETTKYYSTYSLLKLKDDGNFYQMLKVSVKL